jgi:hypothetical protein
VGVGVGAASTVTATSLAPELAPSNAVRRRE